MVYPYIAYVYAYYATIKAIMWYKAALFLLWGGIDLIF